MDKKFGHWDVTAEGIKWDNQKEGDYFIEKSRLLELGPGNDQNYEWLLHIPPKTWLDEYDVQNLNEAFIYAAERFGYQLDQKILDDTLELQKAIIEDKNDEDIDEMIL